MFRPSKLIWLGVFLCVISGIACPQAAETGPPGSHGPAEALYLKLRSVGLDKTQVYKIREATLDRAKLHISLDDGTIAFTQAVDGRITGAFFEGDGEVLIMPPNQAERASLSTFTGGAILEESFSSAYLRFDDDLLIELRPYLRPADDPEGFASHWDSTARNLAGEDGLRLLYSLSDSSPGQQSPVRSPNDRFLHAYLEGNKLGAFDVRYDSLSYEQIQAGQHKHVGGEDYYDVWTSFAVPVAGVSDDSANLSGDEETASPELEITSFKIRAQIKPVKELDAKATLDIRAQERTNRVLFFELSRLLQISEVEANGQPVEFIHNPALEGSHLAKKGNDVVAVILPAPLEKGQQLELTFAYSGAVLSEAANGLLYVGEHGTWYPNRGFAMASFDLEFRYPAGWTLVATGNRVSSAETGSEQITRWVTERPVPVAGFNLGKYSQAVAHAGKVVVTAYATPNVERGFPGTVDLATETPAMVPGPRPMEPARGLARLPTVPPLPPSPSGNGHMVAVAAANAIDAYERYFGPYPYTQLAVTQMPGTVSQGWPGLIFLSSYSFLNPEEKSRLEPDPAKRLMSDEVIAHETAHQWWGDLVNWSSYRDQWIMEALANYSALMLQQSHDPAKFQLIMRNYRDDLLSKGPKGVPLMDAGPVTLGFRLSSSVFPGAYEPICYGRGTWLFYMLHTMMVDAERESGSRHAVQSESDPFIRALRKLRRDYQDRTVTTSQLMQIFASELPQPVWYEGHKSLNWFYDSWVNGDAIPSFALQDVKYTQKAKATIVTGTLVQEHAPDTLVTAVPIYASIGKKELFLKHIFAEGEQTAFRLVAPAGTRSLVIDPEQTLLSRPK
jgi:hypothetical protein